MIKIKNHQILACVIACFINYSAIPQQSIDSTLLTLDRIYSNEFKQQSASTIKWIENGDAYITIEKSESNQTDELISYSSKSGEKTVFVPAKKLNGLNIESFSLSKDGNKVLLFTNSSRVWRSNTKGDYWLYDKKSTSLKQLGKELKAESSLMFAKLSSDENSVFYVYDFNVYKEDLKTGKVVKLTEDGNGDIINGTFDWAYEEEFGKRDGFLLSPKDSYLAFWQVDASDIGTFYMINNTDSIYSQPIPLQYPKVGEDPSGAKLGIINLRTNIIQWVPLPGDSKQHYIPGCQWVDDDLLIIQQMNRHQNRLDVYTFRPSTEELTKIYTEKEDTWVDLGYPDISYDGWGNNDLPLVDDNKAFLRMTENDGWRHIYKVSLDGNEKTLLTPFDFDVASMKIATDDEVFFMASPQNNAQRFLYRTDLKGKGKVKRVTPEKFQGVNNYNISTNGKYAVHEFESSVSVPSVNLTSLPDHSIIKMLLDNDSLKKKIEALKLPKVEFTKVRTETGIDIDARMILPPDFDATKKYPVLFHVYGEPWSQVATDTQIGLWNIFMAQQGYVIIDMDNRGTPSLNGSAWRKSIYRNVGVVNVEDQGLAAKEILKLDYLDEERTAVWGWSGGGTMTLNLLFKFPEIYKTGIAVAAVSNQLIYDNIYQERYMGLPSENREDFINGSPVTHAKNLKGNLLLIHGTADDNVHYQSAEILINELIKYNKVFQFMAYPNRSHGIWEGENTRRHLYTLMTDYILEHTPPN